MRLVVSDTCCLIDLRKAELLTSFLKLPYEILIPDILFEDELLKFTTAQKALMIDSGLKVTTLPAAGVNRAIAVIKEVGAQLSVHDGFAYALAEQHPGCILLTGDGRLRSLAKRSKMEVHGVLWVLDQMHQHALISPGAVLIVLDQFDNDPTVRLPKEDLATYRRRYQAMR